MKTQYQICLFATAPISVSGWICGKLRLGSPSAKTPPSITRKRQAVGFFVDKQANSSCQNRRQKFAQNCEERHSVCVQRAAYWSCARNRNSWVCAEQPLFRNDLVSKFLFFYFHNSVTIWMIFFNNLLKKLDVPLHRKKHISGKERKKLWWESRRELYCDLAFSNWQLAWKNDQLLNFLRLSCWQFAQDTLVPCWYWSVVEWQSDPT